MNMNRFFLCGLALVLTASASLAQTSEDAIRLATQGGGRGVGSRALGMGNAYIGVSDDFTATYWNPAGLAQMRHIEFTGGITNFTYNNSASFLGTSMDEKQSATKLDNIGFALPLPTSQGSFVLAFGYNRVADYTTGISFDAYNPNSSIISSLYDSDPTYDIPFQVYLENSDGSTPINGQVNQSGIAKESGGLGNWAFAAAIDVAKDLSFGVTLNVLNGSYKYERNYVEADTRNFYHTATPPALDSGYLAFNSFYLDNVVDGSISGFNAIFGMMYRSDRVRVGLTMKTPTTVKVSETYTDAGESVFDAGSGLQSQRYSYTADNSYGVMSPWVFGVGVSVEPIVGLLIAGDVDYADWSQIEWTDNQDLERTNTTLQSNFRAVTNIHLGAEYEIPGTDVRVRGGYQITPSPYEGDPSSYDVKTITGGAGILLQNNVLLDLGLGFGKFSTRHSNYIDPVMTLASPTYEDVKTTRVNFTISYRF
jgi:long-chain fatty acid transport protein